MSVIELMPAIKQLNREEKWRVMQFLISELAEEELLLKPNTASPVWSPHYAFEAADKLLHVLKEEEEAHA